MFLSTFLKQTAYEQNVKIERGIAESARVERHWKKETKEKYTTWVQQMEKIWEAMKRRQKEIEDENK